MQAINQKKISTAIPINNVPPTASRSDTVPVL